MSHLTFSRMTRAPSSSSRLESESGHILIPNNSMFAIVPQSKVIRDTPIYNNDQPQQHYQHQATRMSPNPQHSDNDGFFDRLKKSCRKLSLFKILLQFVSIVGVVLIVIGLSCYIYQLVEFKSALDRISDGDVDVNPFCQVHFWDLISFLVVMGLVWEVIGILFISCNTAVMYRTAFRSHRVRELSESNQLILKSLVLLFLGVLMCYIQISVGLLRHSILTKVNNSFVCLDP